TPALESATARWSPQEAGCCRSWVRDVTSPPPARRPTAGSNRLRSTAASTAPISPAPWARSRLTPPSPRPPAHPICTDARALTPHRTAGCAPPYPPEAQPAAHLPGSSDETFQCVVVVAYCPDSRP